MKISVGIPKLNEMLEGGVEQNSSVLLLTDTMVDKASFAQHVLSNRISDEDRGIYLTTSKLPSQIKEDMSEHGYDFKKIIFIDCISNTFGKKVKEKYNLNVKITDTEAALEKTFKIFRKAMEETKNFKFAVFDCLETFMGKNVDKIVKEVKEAKDTMRKTRTTCVYLLTNWGYKDTDIKKISAAFDKVIYLGTVEKKLLWMNYFSVDGKPSVFFVITGTGVNIYIPKILITGPYHSGKSSITKMLSERAISVDRLGTTVSLDHGYIEKNGMVCDIFGTPGQERFDWILKILSRDIWGIILVVDSTNPSTFGRAVEILEEVKGYGIPFVVFANKQDMPKARKPDQIKKEIGLPDVIGTSVVTKQGLEEGLKLLFDKIFKIK